MPAAEETFLKYVYQILDADNHRISESPTFHCKYFEGSLVKLLDNKDEDLTDTEMESVTFLKNPD